MSQRRERNRPVQPASEAEGEPIVKSVQFLDAAPILEGAIDVPRAQWEVTLDGFSHVFHDLSCRLWTQSRDGTRTVLAEDVPLGQVYFDDKGSERNAVQIALNRSGTVYGDFRFMHRIADPAAIYLKEVEGSELADLIVESPGTYTVLEVDIPEQASPGLRRLAFLGHLKDRQAADRSVPE